MGRTRIFFASDLHGSEKCWRKFLNAAKVFKADVLVMGGDIAGKLIVPIVARPNGHFTCTFHGEHDLATAIEVEELEKAIRDGGYYPVRLDPDQLAALSSKEQQDALFSEVMCREFERWLAIAESKLAGTGVRCFVSPGNDDIRALDRLLKNQDIVDAPDEDCVRIDDDHEMISIGFSTPTPWHTERECSEPEYAEKIEGLVARVTDMPKAIFNIHCPPFGTALDKAPEVTEDLRPVTILGQPMMISVGSHAVREAIEQLQPLLGLHGHVHESRGIIKLGRTVCINPGSEYTEGILSGALIRLNGNKVEQFQLVTG
jgi:Icc-related predicted phosphoesterase